MATRHGRSRPFAPPRCDELEPRQTPAAVTVVDYAGGFAGGDEFRGLPTPPTSDDLVLTDGPFQARAVWVPDRVHVGAFETSFVFRQEGEPGRLGDGFTFALTGNVWQSGAAAPGWGTRGSRTAWRSSSTWWTTPGRAGTRSACSPAGPSRRCRPSAWTTARSTCTPSIRSGPTSPTTGPS